MNWRSYCERGFLLERKEGRNTRLAENGGVREGKDRVEGFIDSSNKACFRVIYVGR